MKVLSIKEPLASLLKSGIKKIETRSWATKYRGEIYIHASLKQEKYNNVEFNKIIENLTFMPGYILFKANLVDCVYMTKEYIEDMKKNNYTEYLCGDFKEGRYGWVIDNVEIIKPIKSKGELGIWNYYKPVEILDLMKNIKYGFLDEKGSITTDYRNYKLKSPKDLLRTNYGICFDMVELERYYFKNYYFKTYFIVYYKKGNCFSHTFLVYEDNSKLYWFENSWEKFRGINEYRNLKELLVDVRNKFISFYDIKNINNDLCIYEYKKPKYGISDYDFFKHCESGINIDVDNL